MFVWHLWRDGVSCLNELQKGGARFTWPTCFEDDSLTSHWHDSLRSVRLLDTLTCHQNISKQFKKNKIQIIWIRDMSNKFKQVNCILSYGHAPCTRMMSLGFEFCLSHPWKEDNWAIDRSICDNLGMTCWDAIRLNSSHTHPFTSDPLKTIKTITKDTFWQKDCGKRCSTGFGGLGSTLRPGETETETTRLKPSYPFPMIPDVP